MDASWLVGGCPPCLVPVLAPNKADSLGDAASGDPLCQLTYFFILEEKQLHFCIFTGTLMPWHPGRGVDLGPI